MATKKPFEIERQIATASAKYHEMSTSGKATTGELEKGHAEIKALKTVLSELYATGAVERPKGVKPFGMKVRPGVYEIGNRIDLRSRGETPDEAVQNWNDGLYYFSDGPGVTVGKAETPAE